MGGALAAGVLGLTAGRAEASWPSTPPSPITPFPPTATEVDLSTFRLVGGDGSIDASEIDWYSFVGPKSGSYLIQTSTPSSNLDTVLGVYDGAGVLLASNDDANFPDSSLTVDLTGGVRYYFGITNWAGNSTSGSYSWSLLAPK